MDQKDSSPAQLKGLDNFSKLLDSQFRIPGTNTTFGIDFIIGLIPYAGDIISFMFSGGLVLTMVKYGASGQVLARMLLNIVLDTVVGSIPILGDVFDLYFKSNRRNYELLKKHYGEGGYKGSIWNVIIPVFLVLVFLFFLMIWLIYKVVSIGVTMFVDLIF